MFNFLSRTVKSEYLAQISRQNGEVLITCGSIQQFRNIITIISRK